MGLEQYEKAVMDFSMAIDISERGDFLRYKYYLNRGNALLQLKEWKYALQDFEKVLQSSDSEESLKRAREGKEKVEQQRSKEERETLEANIHPITL
jgi:tetratricopeptide (TPR) repeat protein